MSLELHKKEYLENHFSMIVQATAAVIGLIIIVSLVTVPYVVRPGVGMVKQGRVIGSRSATIAFLEDYRARTAHLLEQADANQLKRDPDLQQVRDRVPEALERLRTDPCNAEFRTAYVQEVKAFLRMAPLPGRGIPRSSKIETYEWFGVPYSSTEFLNDLVMLRIVNGSAIRYLDGKDFPKYQRFLPSNSRAYRRYQKDCGIEPKYVQWQSFLNEFLDSYWQLPALQPVVNGLFNYSVSPSRFSPVRPRVRYMDAGSNNDDSADYDSGGPVGNPVERWYLRHGDEGYESPDAEYDYQYNYDYDDRHYYGDEMGGELIAE